MAWFVESNWGTLSDPETWYAIGMWNRDPQVSREAGAGILVGAGEVLLMASGPNSPALTKAWKSATNTWSWQLGLDPSSAAAAMGVLLGREVLSNIRGPGGSQGLAMREAAEEGLVRAEQLIQKHSANSIEEMWGISPFARGYIAEAMQGGNLPYGFRVFDRFDGQHATSIKSIDLRAASYADNPAAVERRLNRYLDAVVRALPVSRQDILVRPDSLVSRTLEIVIPEGSATSSHRSVIDSLSDRANEYSRLHPETSPVHVKVVEL
ncbi:hypothetical protein [Knoellia remsis]|nr:hypothetical protein [Knoellia remsis]